MFVEVLFLVTLHFCGSGQKSTDALPLIAQSATMYLLNVVNEQTLTISKNENTKYETGQAFDNWTHPAHYYKHVYIAQCSMYIDMHIPTYVDVSIIVLYGSIRSM